MTLYIEEPGSGLLLPGAVRQPRSTDNNGPLDAAAAALNGADLWGNLKGGARKAGDQLLGLVGKPNASGGWSPRYGRLAGLGTLMALVSAASELNDPTESAGRNLAQAVGTGGGSLAGGALGGAAAGAMLSGPLAPVGALVGAGLGAALGGTAGRGLMDALAGVVEGSPEEQALRLAQKQADAQLAMDLKRAQTMLPVQNMASELALQNDRQRAEIAAQLQSRQMMQQTLANALLAQQQAGANQNALLTQSILS